MAKPLRFKNMNEEQEKQEKKDKEIALLWLDLENRVKMHDFGLMMKTYWELFYTLWPEKRKNKKKTPEETVKEAKELLSPDEIRVKLDNIADQMRFPKAE